MPTNKIRRAFYGLALIASLPCAAQTAPAIAAADAIRVLLAAEQETTLIAQMSGRIEVLNAGLGQPVTKGRQIVAMECGESQARLRMADAELVSARENLAAKNGLRQLNAAGDMEVSMAAAAVDRAKGAVSLGQSQVAYCSVNAPFTGRIARIYVKQHQGVNAGAPLVDLVSEGPLKLRLNVPSLYLRQLKVGTPFEVVINETGKPYPAKVTAINSRVDAVAQTVELEARIDGKPVELLAGMSGIARFAFKP
jgi:RND family efflux transporter MFP subunit